MVLNTILGVQKYNKDNQEFRYSSTSSHNFFYVISQLTREWKHSKGKVSQSFKSGKTIRNI